MMNDALRFCCSQRRGVHMGRLKTAKDSLQPCAVWSTLLIKVKWPWKSRLLLFTEFSALYKSIFSLEELWDHLQSHQGKAYTFVLSQSPWKPKIEWVSVLVQSLPSCGSLEAGKEKRLNLSHLTGPPNVLNFLSTVSLLALLWPG